MRRWRTGCVLLVACLAGCGAGPRVEAVDAVTGAPVAAQVRALGDGLLVEADGYESRMARPGERVALIPLWELRFMSPAERPPPLRERDGKPCCPGVQAR